ncbi:MAG: AraC family ligand binding domain-containing protein [Candidatus Methanoperedens sp.]|nr:AraC family ligand binding domain-containing protein [Candidatus Methanoperedens sp.]
MNQINESMNWKDNIERLLVNEQGLIFIIINLIFFSKISIPQTLSKYFEKPLEITVTDGIAILTVFILAAGVLYYAGVYLEAQKGYRLKNLPFNFREKSAITGAIFIAAIIFAIAISELVKLLYQIQYYLYAIFIMVIVLSLFSFMWTSKRGDKKLKNMVYHLILYIIIFFIFDIIAFAFAEQQIFLSYIVIISSLVILFGILGEKHSQKNYNLTLKMIDSSEQIKNLELFDITDIDYRLKDSKTGDEYIVPIGQVKEIVYNNKKDSKNSQYLIDFKSMNWESHASGVRHKEFIRGDERIQLVEFSEQFVEKDWCTKGHIGYVIEGGISIDFNGKQVNFKAGDGLFITEGDKHKGSVAKGEKALVILFEKI